MSENIGIVDSTHLLRRLPVSYPCIGEECLCTMSILVKIAEATLFFLETLAWLAIAYVAFMLVGGGALAWLAGLGHEGGDQAVEG